MKNIFLKKNIFWFLRSFRIGWLTFSCSGRLRGAGNRTVLSRYPARPSIAVTFHCDHSDFLDFFRGGFEKTSTVYEIVVSSGRFSGLFWPLNRFNMSTSAQVSSRENLKFIHGVRKIGGKAWIFSKKSNIWGFFRRHLGLFWREILYRAWWYSGMYVLWGFENATDWSPGREIKPCVLWLRVALRPG